MALLAAFILLTFGGVFGQTDLGPGTDSYVYACIYIQIKSGERCYIGRRNNKFQFLGIFNY